MAWGGGRRCWPASQETVTIRRELAARWPDAYQHELEQSLRVVAWLEQEEDLSNASGKSLKRDNGLLSLSPGIAFMPLADTIMCTYRGGTKGHVVIVGLQHTGTT